MRGDRKKQDGREKESENNSLEESKMIDIWNYKPKRIQQLMWRECTPRAFLSGHIKNEESRSSLT